MRAAIILGLALSVTGCSTIAQPTRMIAQQTRDWRQVATEADRAKLRDWRRTFVDAIAAAKKAGHAAEIEAEGALLDPDAALGAMPLPNGDYGCRVIKVGPKTEGMLAYIAYPGFTCRVSAQPGGLQKLRKLNGSQRQVGLLFPGDQMRQTFLGTLALGDELGALQYGLDDARDVAGFVERIGPNRWRLVMPQPHYESQLDVMELVPLK